MSERTITLSGFALLSLRRPGEIVVTDNGGQLVAICPDGVASEATDELRVSLSAADLDLIESPEGLIVADVTRTTGWRIFTEAAR